MTDGLESLSACRCRTEPGDVDVTEVHLLGDTQPVLYAYAGLTGLRQLRPAALPLGDRTALVGVVGLRDDDRRPESPETTPHLNSLLYKIKK